MSIWKWGIDGEPVSFVFILTNYSQESKVMDIEIPVLDMHWYPSGKGSNEVLGVACSDGSYKLISKAGRIEKSVAEAHNGAIICIKWSYEGTLATAGEDG